MTILDLKKTSIGSRYVFAILAVALVFGITLQMNLPRETAPISLFLCAIAISSWLGGIGPGLVSIALSAFVFDCFFGWSLLGRSTHTPCISFFFPSAFLIGGLAAAQRSAIRSGNSSKMRLHLLVEELKSANSQLEKENSERKRVQERLRITDTFLSESQKVSSTGSWRLNLTNWTMEWSEGHYRIFGRDPSDITPCVEIYHSVVHPDDSERVRTIVGNAINDRHHFECEYRIVLSCGAIRYIRGSGSPASCPAVVAEEYIGISVDITEQRQTEQLLRKSENKYRTLAENSPDGVVRYDENFRRIYINPAQLRHYGVTSSEVLNRSADAYWRADVTVDTYKKTIREVMDTGNPAELFGEWQRIDGSTMYWAVNMVAENNVDGESKTVLAIVRDITTIKEAERRLQESHSMLRQLADRDETVREEERKHLARELHDDLAQYLSALRMKMALSKMRLDEKDPELAAETSTMIDMVDGTIKVVRNAITTLRPTALDMDVTLALEWLANNFAKQTGLNCKLHIGDDSISLSDKISTAVFRIAQESLRNVEKHAQASSVDIHFSQLGDYSFLIICDDGKGFDPNNVSKDSFGLIGIHERANILGGKMNIDSAPGCGTTIRVQIPFTS